MANTAADDSVEGARARRPHNCDVAVIMAADKSRPEAALEVIAATHPSLTEQRASIMLRVPRLPDTADTLTAARHYAANGWYVGPAAAGTKNPGSVLGRRWPKATTRDEAEIVAMFAGTSHNVFLHVGRSGAVAFDVDTPEHLHPLLTSAITSLEPPFQSTRRDIPGRGHYVFRLPAGLRLGNGLGNLGGGWGEIRGDNGVIIAAPSRHVHGGKYHWVTTGVLPVLPDYLLDALGEASPTAAAAPSTDVLRFLEAHVDRSFVPCLAWHVRSYLQDVEDGESRHASMIGHLAGAMKDARSGLYPARHAERVLRRVFLATLKRPPLGPKQGAVRVGAAALGEWNNMLAWAVAQAMVADIEEHRSRVRSLATTFRATTTAR